MATQRSLRWWLAVLLITVFSIVRVATTHRVFSQTHDEPWHLIGGYDILTKGSYTADLEHPPLARFLFALPFVDSPDPKKEDALARGNALLLRNDRYTQNLGRARVGNLVFLAVGIVVVAMWASDVISPAAGIIAAMLFASLPPVLGHAGVATTDMAITATLPFALYMLSLVLAEPTNTRAILLGVAIGAGLLSKYSFLVYFPIGAVVLLVGRRIPIARLLMATVIAAVIVWAAYGFTFGTMASVDPRANEVTRAGAAIPVPAPAFGAGALRVQHHNQLGHKSFLLDRMSIMGWWYYFPVALFFKTPVPFLVLTFAGCAYLTRRDIRIVLIAAGILVVAMTSHINIGVRHVMPIYAPLSIAAAAAVTQLRLPRWIPGALAAWLVAGSLLAHPDYIPWFNFMAGRHPERILNDSNLDWGQDVLRLVRECRRSRIDHITLSLFTTAELEKIGLPRFEILQALTQPHGWLAISEMNVAQGRAYSPEVKKWLDALIGNREYRSIGKTIRLYRLP